MKKNILIIDDEEDITLNLNSIVARHIDCKIKIANGFSEAVGILQAYRPDIIFLDIQLKDGSGYDLINTIAVASPLSRIIVMSAYNIEKKTLNNIYHFIQKPFYKEDIVNVLQKQ